MIDILNKSYAEPIEPHIDVDGLYVCQRCYTKLKLLNNKCPKCNQTINWSWMDDRK